MQVQVTLVISAPSVLYLVVAKNDVMCRTISYDVIFPINSQYLKTWGVDSPACTLWKI